MPHLHPTHTRLASVETMQQRIAIRAKVRKIEHYTRNEYWKQLRDEVNELAVLLNNFCQDTAPTPSTGETQQKETQCISQH